MNPRRDPITQGQINSSEEDQDIISVPQSQLDPLTNIIGPMIRARARKMNEALNGLVKEIQIQEESKIKEFKPKMVILLAIISPSPKPPSGM